MRRASRIGDRAARDPRARRRKRRPAARPRPLPRASLTDIENDVMCVVVPRAARGRAVAAGRLRARLISGLIAKGETKAQIERRSSLSTARRCSASRRRTGST